jgi:hypothetical protein
VIGDLHEVVPPSAEIRKAGELDTTAVIAPRSPLRRSSRSRRAVRPAGSSRPARPLGKPLGAAGSQTPAGETVVVLGQRKLFQRLVPGLMHAFIFWGFVVLFPTIVMA